MDGCKLGEAAEADLMERGFARRDIARIAVVFGAGAGLAALAGTPTWAQSAGRDSGRRTRLRLDANECWTGPLAPGAAAAAEIIARSNRYDPAGEREAFQAAVAAVEGVPTERIVPWHGSSDPLSRSIVSFCSPTRGLVTADPVFELAGDTAKWLGAPVKRVAMTATHAHDVRAMVAADPTAGVYYVVSPNNPTGAVTPVADIAWLAANKPAGSVLVVDEAYIHFDGGPSAIRLAATRDDVVVLRTFSKLFGMAGMRLGYLVAAPKLIERMMRYDGGMQSWALPMPSLACATASLGAASLIAARRAEMEAAREETAAFLAKRGYRTIPSRANMLMIDWRRPAKPVRESFRAAGIEIGRSWAGFDSWSRLTVGSADEMARFRASFDRVLTV